MVLQGYAEPAIMFESDPTIQLYTVSAVLTTASTPTSLSTFSALVRLAILICIMAQAKRQGLAERFLSGLIDALRLLEAGDETRRAGKETPLWQRLEKSGRADTKLVQEVLHLLYVRCNGRAAAKKELRSCWPITESSQQKEFKAAMQAWVRGLATAGRLPQQAAHCFVTAYQTWGMRTAELLFHLAVLALEAELERRHPELLTTVAPTLQDAAPSVFDLAVAEDQHRLQLELERLGQLLSTLQRLQQLFKESAAAAGEGAPHLQPWWPTSQAHAERLLAMQQLIRPSALAEVPRLANADQTLGLLLDAAATASTCPAEQSDSTGGVLQVLAVRTAVAEQQGSVQPSNEANCPALNCKIASRHFHLRALLVEAERAMQQPPAGLISSQKCSAAGTPASVLELPATSPPRRNPISDAQRSLAVCNGDLQAWSGAWAESDAVGKAVSAARELVWTTVQARPAPTQPEPGSPLAAAPAEGTSLGTADSSAGSAADSQEGLAASSPHAYTPPHPLALPDAGQPHQPEGPHSPGPVSLQPSPTLASMLDSHLASPFLLSPCGLGGTGFTGAASPGAGGFSMPPSLTPTPRWGVKAAAASEGGAGPCAEGGTQERGAAASAEPLAQEQLMQLHHERQAAEQEGWVGGRCATQQQPQPDSPCFAESIASFSVAGYGVGSAAEALAQQCHRQSCSSRLCAVSRAGGLQQVSAGLVFSPMASASMEPSRAAPFQASLPAANADKAVECVTAPTPDSHVQQHYSHVQQQRQYHDQQRSGEPGAASLVTTFSPPRPLSDSPVVSRSQQPAEQAHVEPQLRHSHNAGSFSAAPALAAMRAQLSRLGGPGAAERAQRNDSHIEKQLVAVAKVSSSPTVSLYSPPKALDSPAGSVVSQRQARARLQNITNSAQHRNEPGKTDVDSLRLRFQRLKSRS